MFVETGRFSSANSTPLDREICAAVRCATALDTGAAKSTVYMRSPKLVPSVNPLATFAVTKLIPRTLPFTVGETPLRYRTIKEDTDSDAELVLELIALDSRTTEDLSISFVGALG